MTKRICSIEDCGKPHRTKGYCESHYFKHRKYGDAEYINPKPLGAVGRGFSALPCRISFPTYYV